MQVTGSIDASSTISVKQVEVATGTAVSSSFAQKSAVSSSFVTASAFTGNMGDISGSSVSTGSFGSMRSDGLVLRPAASASVPQETGSMVYDSTDKALRVYVGTEWLPVQPVSGSASWVYTGADQDWIVPSGVSTLVVYMWGAGGGGGKDAGKVGGSGGYTTGVLTVTAGISLKIVVGGGGARAGSPGGSGGGYSGIFNGTHTHGNAIMIAGGGGGSAFYYSGGQGGGTAGGDTSDPYVGYGGTQTHGGVAGTYTPGGGVYYTGQTGSALLGGAGAQESEGLVGGGSAGGWPGGGAAGSNPWTSGGGGSGYYGGGGGANGAPTSGGGGSGYIGSTTSGVLIQSGTTYLGSTYGIISGSYDLNPVHPGTREGYGGTGGAEANGNGGNGFIFITYLS